MKYDELKKIIKIKEFPAEVCEWGNISAYLTEILEKQKVDNRTTIELTIVLEEVFVNIASYAYENLDVDKKIMHLGTAIKDNSLYLVFIDSGIPFNPLEKEDPDFNATLENMKIGGLGIYMIKNWASDIAYERIEGKNILMFKKDL